ncbi:MAG: hypothetical protein WAU30_09880 [Propionicimonas sp.]
MKKVAIIVVIGLFLSGCWDVLPRMFRVTNDTGNPIVIEARRPDGELFTTEKAEPGSTVEFTISSDGCDSKRWVVKTGSGEILAEILGACPGHIWTVRGLNDSSYS